MARRAWTALSIFIIVFLLSSTAHAFALLSEDEDAQFCPSRESPHAFTLMQQVAAKENCPRLSQEKPYTVESVFSFEFPKVLVRDAIYTVTSPVRWDKKDWLTLGAGIAGITAATLADKPIRTQVQHIQNASATNVAKQIRQFGGAYSYGTLGLFLAGGKVYNNPAARTVFIDGAAATLISGGITLGLKYAVGRYRPPEEKGNHYFQPFSSNAQSFPSGETTQAFAVASVIASHYDELLIKGASYGIASLVGLARIYQDAHWTSDAAAGALIGIAVGTATVHFNDERRSNHEKQRTFFITPIFARNTTGVGITCIY